MDIFLFKICFIVTLHGDSRHSTLVTPLSSLQKNNKLQLATLLGVSTCVLFTIAISNISFNDFSVKTCVKVAEKAIYGKSTLPEYTIGVGSGSRLPNKK